jgi:hypothetical protein
MLLDPQIVFHFDPPKLSFAALVRG